MLCGLHMTDSSALPLILNLVDTDIAEMTEDQKKKLAMKKVQPILESSDELRQNLRSIDINIMVLVYCRCILSLGAFKWTSILVAFSHRHLAEVRELAHIILYFGFYTSCSCTSIEAGINRYQPFQF